MKYPTQTKSLQNHLSPGSVWFNSAQVCFVVGFLAWFINYIPSLLLALRYSDLSLWVEPKDCTCLTSTQLSCIQYTPPHLNTIVACRGITANVFYQGSTMLTGAARNCAKCGNFLVATSHFPLACYCFWLPSRLSWVFPSYTIMTVIQHAQLYGMQASYSAIHKAQHCCCVLRDNCLCCLNAVYASGSSRLVKNKLLQS